MHVVLRAHEDLDRIDSARTQEVCSFPNYSSRLLIFLEYPSSIAFSFKRERGRQNHVQTTVHKPIWDSTVSKIVSARLPKSSGGCLLYHLFLSSFTVSLARISPGLCLARICPGWRSRTLFYTVSLSSLNRHVDLSCRCLSSEQSISQRALA